MIILNIFSHKYLWYWRKCPRLQGVYLILTNIWIFRWTQLWTRSCSSSENPNICVKIKYIFTADLITFCIFRIRQFTSGVTSLTNFKSSHKGSVHELKDAIMAIGSGYLQPNEQLTGVRTEIDSENDQKQYALLFDTDLLDVWKMFYFFCVFVYQPVLWICKYTRYSRWNKFRKRYAKHFNFQSIFFDYKLLK